MCLIPLVLVVLFEVTTKKSLEGAAMASFVLAHFVYGVVDGVVAEFFGALCKGKFAFGGACFGCHAELEILLGVRPDDFTEEFCKFGCVFGFFEGYTLVGFRDFREAFAISLAAHREVHAHFGTFAIEVFAQALYDFGVQALSDTNLVLVGPIDGSSFCFYLFKEFALRGVTLWTFIWCFWAHMDVTADFANPYFHFVFSFFRKAEVIDVLFDIFVIITNI